MEIVVTQPQHNRCYFVFHDSRAEYMEEEQKTRVGNIYAGIVTRVQKNIGAAFVRIGEDKDDTGFLPLKEIPSACILNRTAEEGTPIRAGDHLLVQVASDEAGDKKPKLKCTLALSGRYTVVTLGRAGVGASKQIPARERRELITSFQSSVKETIELTSFGVLLRTEAFSVRVTMSVIVTEAERFTRQLMKLTTNRKEVPALLYERPHEERMLEKLLSMFHFCQRYLLTQGLLAAEETQGTSKATADAQNLTAHPVRIIAQNKELRKKIKASGFPYMRPEIEVLLAGNEDDLVNRSRKIYREATGRTVRLKSGGILYFDTTEALTAIDVNTSHTALKDDPSKKEGRKTLAEKISMEAAPVIMRQIRMRNLSGIILIDFPTMPKAASARVLKQLRILSALDAVPVTVHDFTALGIAELTRERINKPLNSA